ncbi:hypothetical protein LSH36_110g03010 [Paralvinella palmiformis]|uniref:Uncharacterized protein n=1 Tax=Paralvinella palmiformis TaxID=53620 RepID=A0AAD9K0D5_9ANNE|nr:hypothetical protein LSH36_110g03010 [Paralvinella palmiformis]
MHNMSLTRGSLHEPLVRDITRPYCGIRIKCLTPASISSWIWLEDRGRSTNPHHNNRSSSPSIHYTIKYGCKKNKYWSNGSSDLIISPAPEMCMCGVDEEGCDNVSQEYPMGINDDEDDTDP